MIFYIKIESKAKSRGFKKWLVAKGKKCT